MKSEVVIRDGKLLPADGSFDAGLLVLSLVTPRGTERSQTEIAEVCGVTQQAIQYIESRAIRKIRAELIRRGVYNF